MYNAYRIEENDNLDIISSKVDCSKDELERLNSGFNFSEGDILTVPTEKTLFDIYTVLKGDTLYSIGNKYNIPYNELVLLNGLDKNDYIYPNQQLLIPKSGVNFYITKENEKLKDVIKNLGSGGYEIIKNNDNLVLMPDQIIVY